MTVHVVTDSASDLSPDVAAALGVTVVPLTVTLAGGHELLDRCGPDGDEFHRRLAADGAWATTSAPSPGAFATAFSDALARASHVVCITMSAGLSGTVNAARTAATLLGPGDAARVTVIDSGAVSAGLATVVTAAAAAAAAGATAAEVAATAEQLAPTVHTLAVLDTIDHVRRGGRVTNLAAMVGTVLSVKPVVAVRHGTVEMVARPRTMRRALAWVTDQLAADAPVDSVVVIHALSGDTAAADAFAGSLEGLAGGPVPVTRVGAVIASHSGPGMIGVSYRTPPRPVG